MKALFLVIVSLYFSPLQAEQVYRFNSETAQQFLDGTHKLPTFEETMADAQRGVVFAQSRLGDLYNSGLDVKQNVEKAVFWYKKAKENGDNRAPFVLATMYEYGNRVLHQDTNQEISLYLLAAERGYLPAFYRLGAAYSIGKGVPKNYVSAYAWWNISAAQGDKYSAKYRDEISFYMTKSQIEKAQELSESLYERYVDK
jgi:TPR repeat protein